MNPLLASLGNLQAARRAERSALRAVHLGQDSAFRGKRAEFTVSRADRSRKISAQSGVRAARFGVRCFAA